MTRNRIAFSVLAFIAMLMVLAVPAAATDNVLYFNPDNSSVSGYCSSVDVQVIADISESNPSSATSINITFDPSCGDVTNWALDSGWNSGMDSSAWSLPLGFITISTSVGANPAKSGSVPLGTLTLHCNDTDGCCGSWLNFTLAEYTNSTDTATIVAATDDGTFMCGDGITVTKKVLDGSVWVDALGPLGSDWLGKDVIFNITVTAGCMPLSNLVVSDVMDSGLEYNDNASPGETSNTTHTATWNLGSLSASTSTSIEFNATIVGYGTSCNDATATAGVTDLGLVEVSATDQASVTTMPPAGIDVTKTVWDPAKGEWVKEINSTLDYVNIGDLASEAGHLDMNADDWSYIGSPTCTGSCLPSGGYGGYDGGSADFRGLMGPPTGCGAGHEHANFTMDAGAGTATKLVLRHLDGLQDDSFDVFIVEGGQDILIGHYAFSGNTNEYWTTTTFNFAPRTGVIEFKLVATDPVGSWCSNWGQVMINWAELLGDRATIGDTYRFRCEVENTGSPTMDVCEITVTDVLPAGLAYADNAKLQDHHGVWWDINPPDIAIPASNTYGWIIDNWVPGECLQPGQKIVVEYDVTVTNYGLSCNDITAEAYCSSATSWVQNNDSACIDTPAPDLIVSDITVNYDGSGCAGEAFGPLPPNGTNTQPNNISADITELNSIAVVFPFDVTFEISNGGTVVATHTVQLPSIAAGATDTVYCDNVFFPIAGETYTINVTVDSADDVIETVETNNLMQLVKTAIVNGYKGGLWQDGRTIGKMNCIQGNINIVRSLGDSSYVSSYYYPDWTDYDVVWTSGDLPIPTAGTSIKKARLYVYHQTDKTPAENITDYFKLEFNGYELPIVASFKDAKGFGSSDWTSPVGMIAYDVTHKVQIGNNNIANLTNQVPGGGNVTISGMMLIVVYENLAEPERMIWINEGLDLLYAKDVYNINSTEATAHGAFTDCYPIPANMSKATLVTVAPLGNSATSTKLFFNGHEFLGAWPAYSGSTHVCLAEHDVSSYLSSTANTFAFQSYKPAGATIGDFMAASNAILIVEKGYASQMSVEPELPASGGDCYNVGERFDVLINIDPKGAPIMGAQFDLDFDESVLFAETVTYGDFLTQGGASVTVSYTNVDNSNGVVSFAAGRQGTTDGVTMPGTFAIVTFTAVTQDTTSVLDLTDALASTNETPVVTFDLVTTDGSVDVCSNPAPVVIARSDFTYNNIAERGLSKAYFNGTDSYDSLPGTITLHEWWVDDGTGLVGEIAEHLFEVPMYWNLTTACYVPASVTLKVTDDGMPLMDNSTTMEVTVWIAGDTTGDGRVNIADTVTFGMNFGEQAEIGSDGLRWYNDLEGDKADLNNDGWVNIGDAMLLGTSWGHTAW